MEYIGHLNSFAAASLAAGLGPNEITVYMRLFWQANAEFWPECIEISLAELCNITGIKSHHTLLKARKSLEEGGFITFVDIKGKKTRYQISELTPRQKLPRDKIPRQKLPKHLGKNCLAPGQKLPRTMAKFAHPTPSNPSNDGGSETSKDYKTNKTNKTIFLNSAELSKVYQEYTDNIALDISPINREKLRDDLDVYGCNKIVKAIHYAAKVKKKSLGFVEYILKNGIDTERGRKCGSNSNASKSYEEFDRIEETQQLPWLESSGSRE